MPRRTIRKPLLARLGKAAQIGAGAYNNFRRAGQLRDLLEGSDDETLKSLGNLIDPLTGELSSTGAELLQQEMSNRRTNMQQQAVLNRMMYQQDMINQRADETRADAERKQYVQTLLDLDDTYKQNSKGKDVLAKEGIISRYYGIDPQNLSNEQKQDIARGISKGKLPSVQKTGLSAGKVPGKGFFGLFTPEKDIFDEDIPAYEVQY